MTTPWSPEKHIRALKFAAHAHQGQTLPDSPLPYVVHVALVAMEVMTALQRETHGDGDLAVQCALLHDVLEDTAATWREVAQAFGPAVADGVAALSKNADLDKALRMADSLERIRRQPREVWLVKLADRITNLAPPPPSWPLEKVRRYREEAEEILRALGDASPWLAGRLRERIQDYMI